MSEQSGSASTGPDSDAQRLLASLERWFAESGIRAVLIGGMATNFWKEPRFTHDLDFTVIADQLAEARLSRVLAEAGFRISRSEGSHLASGPDFTRFVRDSTGDIVELQAAKTEYQQLVIDRGVRLDARQPVAVATVEDLIVLKLIAGRSIDQHDLAGLAVLPGIDWPYVEHWAGVWEVRDQLDRLRAFLGV